MSDSKLSSKFQATIPQDIRSLLDLQAGDRIIFEVNENKQVTIKKATPLDIIYLRSIESSLTEWNSKNDAEDHRDL